MLKQKMPEIILTNHQYGSSPVPKSRLYHSLIYKSMMSFVLMQINSTTHLLKIMFVDGIIFSLLTKSWV